MRRGIAGFIGVLFGCGAMLPAPAATNRFAATTLTLPPHPPATTYQVVDAFPGMTFSAPTTMESAPGDTNRLFVGELAGRIYVVTNAGSATPGKTLFLDIADRVTTTNSELGLKGLALHPGFTTSGVFFVTYCTTQSTVRLSRFTRLPGQPDAADPDSEVCLIELPGNRIHNIDDAQFGPDGYLYVSFGDQATGLDETTNTQVITKDFWSSILRIDPDRRPGGLEPHPHPGIGTNGAGLAHYTVPPDNPFVGATQFNGSAVNPAEVRTEMYAVGFRNPWQFSFDPLNGELWVGDVGASSWEKVNVMTAGANAGWAFYEGNHEGYRTPPPGFTFTPPVWEYPHGELGSAICGGLVVRGTRYPELDGRYLCADIISGNLWALQRGPGTTVVERIAGDGSSIVQFGRDPASADILMVGYGVGQIRRLVTESETNSFPATLSGTGVFADLATLEPHPGVVPYDVNLPFWSDHALKRRWFAVTNLSDGAGYALDEAWTTPPGMVWIKHFDFDLDAGNTNTRRRLETRLIVRTTNGAYGVSYRWNEAGTEAFLVPDAGETFALAVTNGGVPGTQMWRIPGRSECLTCHRANSGWALSFETRQLNHPGQLGGVTGNFLTLLADAGYVTNPIPDPATLPRYRRADETAYTRESRVRSYLAVNCSYCHRGAGSLQGAWDGRPHLLLEDMGLLNVPAGDNGGNTNNLLLVPGDPAHSIVWNRIAASNGFARMPPLATSVLDTNYIRLVADWITLDLPGRTACHPTNAEACDGIDNNCDGLIDEGLPTVTWYRDADGDGFGDLAQPLTTCATPAGYVTNALDCDDAQTNIHPGAAELCDGIDNDCDGTADEGLPTVTWYRDADGDGFGDPALPLTTCATPAGYVTNALDCDDARTNVYPGAAEVCDGIDNDCDATIDEGCAGPAAARREPDTNGDGTSEIAVYYPPLGTWYVRQPAGSNLVVNWGWDAALPSPGDYDGDGRTDLTVYHPGGGAWYVRQSTGGTWVVNWGWSAALPTPGDYDGDNRTDVAVHHPGSGLWYVRQSGGGTQVVNWGWSAAMPAPADFDGDGRTDIAVYHPAGGTWYVRQSTGGTLVVNWGWSAAAPVPGDYDGDGRADIAVYHAAAGTWYIRRSSGGTVIQNWGWSAAVPVPGDYDDDGRTDVAVYHPATGTWYVQRSTGGTLILNWGWSAARPVTPQHQINRWIGF